MGKGGAFRQSQVASALVSSIPRTLPGRTRPKPVHSFRVASRRRIVETRAVMSRLTACIVSVAVTLPALAANRPVPYRTAPPAGIVITAEDRERLQLGTARLEVEIESLRARSGSDARVRKLLPDVEIFHKAVDWALRYDEFFRSNLSRELTLLSGPGRILSFSREKEHWQARSAHQPLTTTAGVKSPKLQGPIDDAFMENFLVVRPSKPSSNGNVGKWIETAAPLFLISAPQATRNRRPNCPTTPCSTSPCLTPKNSHAEWRSPVFSTRLGNCRTRPLRPQHRDKPYETRHINLECASPLALWN